MKRRRVFDDDKKNKKSSFRRIYIPNARVRAMLDNNDFIRRFAHRTDVCEVLMTINRAEKGFHAALAENNMFWYHISVSLLHNEKTFDKYFVYRLPVVETLKSNLNKAMIF